MRLVLYLIILVTLSSSAFSYPAPKTEQLFVYGEAFYDEQTGGWLVVNENSGGPQTDLLGNVIGESYYYCMPDYSDCDSDEPRYNPNVEYPVTRTHSEVKAGIPLQK